LLDKNILWYKRNQLNDDNIDYIQNVLCIPYKISAKVIGSGDFLLLTYRLDTYRVEVDREQSCLLLCKRNKALNPKGKEQYHFLKQFDSCDCWCDLIMYVVRKDNLNVEAC
jgi:hypothetical protein